jgi:hypothetical protein
LRLDIVNWVVVLFETTRQFAAPVVPPGVTTATKFAFGIALDMLTVTELEPLLIVAVLAR